jgi:hypothetical protein
MDEVLRNLNREIRGIERRTAGGMKAAADHVLAETIPRTPVDSGNLRNSGDTAAFETSQGPVAEIFFTADYAVFVHEINKNYTVGGWKYLETTLKEEARNVLEIIRSYARIK